MKSICRRHLRHPGGFSNYDPQTNTLRLGGIGAIPSDTGVRTFLGGFAPRMGVSWRLNDQTVIRGGYGGSLFTPGAEVKGYYNYPVRQYFLTTGANSYVPAGSLASGFPARCLWCFLRMESFPIRLTRAFASCPGLPRWQASILEHRCAAQTPRQLRI